MGRVQRKIADIQPFAELAQGATAVVYKGYQEGLDRFVLLKVLRSGLGHDDERLRRFEEEARLIAQVQHPNVVAVYAAGRDDGAAYIAAEFVEGFDLRDLSAQRSMPPELAVFIVLEAARGLQAAHAHGILHRDLKPSNILIAHDGQVKLTDFGMASFVEEEAGAEVRGTPGYLAPELVQGAPPTKASDLFSLGATFYEILAGRAAFAGDDTGTLLDAVLHHDPLPRLERFIDLPDDVRRICARLLAKDPAARYADAEALIDDLEACRAARGMTTGAAALKTYLDDPEVYLRLQRATVQRAGIPPAPVAVPPMVPEAEDRAAVPAARPAQSGQVRWAWAGVLVLLVGGGLGGSLLLKDAPSTPLAEPLEEVADRSSEAAPNRSALPGETDTAEAAPTITRTDPDPEATQQIEQPEVIDPPDEDVEERVLSVEADTTAMVVAAVTRPDSTVVTPPDTAAAAPGTLSVDVQPWAEVYVDDELVGRTPFAPLTLAAGTHRVALKHPQFPDYNTEVTVRAGETEALGVSLWDHVGRLSLEVSPWAVVAIDGAVRDTTPLDRPLIVKPGDRRLSLRHAIGVHDTVITVMPGEIRTLRFNLNELLRR